MEGVQLRIGQPEHVFGPGRRLEEGNGTLAYGNTTGNTTNVTAEAVTNTTTETPRRITQVGATVFTVTGE